MQRPGFVPQTIEATTLKPATMLVNSQKVTQTAVFKPALSKPILIAGKWNTLWKGMSALIGAVTTTLSIAQGVQGITPNTCPRPSREFPIRNYNTWNGQHRGYRLGLSDQGYLAGYYPNGVVKTTSNVYHESSRNQWRALLNTPYAYCISGSDGVVRARFED